MRGYGVTDDLAVPGKGVIGDGAVVPARGYLVVWLDGNPEAGPTHVAAHLSKAGGGVGLARPDGSYIDQLTYGAQETDLSAAREPDGAPAWAIEWHVSPGAANPAGSGQAGTPAADPESVPTAGDPSDRILGYDQMPQFSLTIGAAEIQSLLHGARHLRAGDADLRRARLRAGRACTSRACSRSNRSIASRRCASTSTSSRRRRRSSGSRT